MKNEAVARDRIVSSLKNLALSTYEAEVYATLLAHPTMTASALCKETGISDTKIYYALDGLSEKGMLIVAMLTQRCTSQFRPKRQLQT